MWNFNFEIDGKADMMSLNPLEMTNFEMMGAIFGFGGLALTILLKWRAGKAHHFVEQESDEGAAD
jgi:hypothetical protein